MRIRRWPVILGSTLLFGVGTASCSSAPGPLPEDTTQSAASDIGPEAQEDAGVRAPEPTSDASTVDATQQAGDAVEPPVEDAMVQDGSMTTDTMEVDSSSPEDASETLAQDTSVSDTEESQTADATDGSVAEEDTSAPEEDVVEADAAPMVDAVAETDVEESLPEAGDPCLGDVFGGDGGICMGDPPEPYLICSWEGVYIPAKEFEGIDLCQCADMNEDGYYEVICASPGFVGIAQSGRDRTQFKSLRRA